MGLYCLSLAGGEPAVHQIRRGLSDVELVPYCSGGCMVYQSSVGAFACALLLYGDPLSYPSRKQKPLITSGQALALSLETLADDNACHLHQDCARLLLAQLFAHKEKDSLATLKKDSLPSRRAH